MAECPRCSARPPEGYGHQCSNGRWVIEVRPEDVADEQEAEALSRLERFSELEHEIAEGAARADAMARLEADLRRLPW